MHYMFLYQYNIRIKGRKKSCKYLLFLGLESSVNAGAELSEIDARLQALQEYMRDLDTGH